jgi:hypothetical protein
MKCAAPLQPGQDWCLQCGSGAPGSLGASGWHTGGAILAVVVLLVLGALAAGYAALNKGTPKAAVVTTTVAQTSPPAATTPTTTTPVTPGATATTPSTKSPLGLGAVKPPKIPLTAITPVPGEKVAKTTTPEFKSTTTTTTTPSSSTPSGTGTNSQSTSEESQQSAIVLDTNAATPYNPYNYPAEWFGDPSLAIDGDTSTAWTALVNPASAPAMAEGLLIDLKAKHKIAVLQLVTSTPGMTVQVYGANGHTVPTSITDPAWIPLSAFRVVKKKHLRLKLRDSKKAFTYITLWISKAPAAAVGSATAPGHVDINEVELFPTR